LTDNCVFCEIVKNKDAKGFKKHGYTTVSFIPLNPVTPGHRLFVPVTHAFDAGDSPVGAAMAVNWAARWGAEKNEDFNLITSRGKFATQTILHTHIHYVPRRENDGLFLPWTEHWCL
jgi:histidine triad (HIT) family protein